MNSRLELHEKLCELLGSRNVYFQPPESLKITYPCIIYNLSNLENLHANDSVYNTRTHYDLLVIDKSPVSKIPEKINNLPRARFNRFYTSDNLNHYAFGIFY